VSVDSLKSEKCKLDVRKKEKWYTILLQILFPFLAAGLGMVGAGIFLDYVQVIKLNQFQALIIILFLSFFNRYFIFV
jgi:hypothetical protein